MPKKNQELPNMPEMDTVAKIASEILDIEAEIQELRTRRHEKEKAFVTAASATGRNKISCPRGIVALKRIIADTKVEVKIAKEKKAKPEDESEGAE